MRTVFLLSCIIFSVLLAGCKKDDAPLNDYKVLGISAHDILSASNYNRLTIQVLGQNNFQPSQRVADSVSAILDRHINKPGGIQFIYTPLPATTKTDFTINEVAQFERTYRSSFTGGTNLSVCLTILDKPFASMNVVANSYWNTSFAISKKAIDDRYANASLYQKENILITLIIHEFGHLMGLVDLGSPMTTPHRDGQNGNHCNSVHCIMHYAIEAGIASSGAIPAFDANCLADIRANGGR